ncbi:MAG: cell division protein ZipA C-terminal FtsZ-binding domain-containing protein [Methylophilaceae bacterium]|nr:cell division protein ZipA C-terminal FtsZ-binding domain-containing protein [Methylophilaceae bacterium]
MSQLQIGLISLGVLIILGVLLFNWWQERNIRREMYRRFEGPIDDVLMKELQSSDQKADEDFHIDPEVVVEHEQASMIEWAVTSTDPATAQTEQTETAPDDMPDTQRASSDEAHFIPETMQKTGTSSDIAAAATEDFAPTPIRLSDPPPAARDEVRLPPEVDPQIDEIALLVFQNSFSGMEIRNALQPLPIFSKSVRWLGRDANGAWHALTREQEQNSFYAIACALQLVDRSGPANGEDLRNLHVKMEDVADRIGGKIEWVEHTDPLHYARELDQFCLGVDVTISLRLIAGPDGPFAGTKLRGVAEANGLSLKEDGRFYYQSPETGEPLYALACLDQRALTTEVLRTGLLRGVVLMMDVPRVPKGIEVFNQMVLLGRKFETVLGCRLMDENQHPLGDVEIDKIRQQLRVIYSSMFARGIIPGSPTALRLFS